MRTGELAGLALLIASVAIGSTAASAGGWYDEDCACFTGYPPAPAYSYAPPTYYAPPPVNYAAPPAYGYYAAPPSQGYAYGPPVYDAYYGYAGWRRW
jgi:hypothetical protein